MSMFASLPLVLATSLSVWSCSAPVKDPARTAGRQLVLDVYVPEDNDHNLVFLGAVETYDKLLARLEHLDRVRLTISEHDVVQAVMAPAPSECISLKLTDTASARWRQSIPVDGSDPPFVVRARGTTLFAGQFIYEGSARAIDTPVIYADTSHKERVVLHINASHPGGSPHAAERIDREPLRSIFARRGALRIEARPRCVP